MHEPSLFIVCELTSPQCPLGPGNPTDRGGGSAESVGSFFLSPRSQRLGPMERAGDADASSIRWSVGGLKEEGGDR